MKKKNGFVFIETMIVVIVLIVGLLILYSSYTGFISIERRIARYDDPAYLYKTQALADFLSNIKDELGNSKLYDKIKNIDNDYTVISQFDESGLFNNENDKTFYSNLNHKFRIQNVIVMKKEQIESINYEDNILDDDFIKYIKQIQVGTNKYYLIVSFAEKNNGNECDPNQLTGNISSETNVSLETSCIFYYASVPVNIYGG